MKIEINEHVEISKEEYARMVGTDAPHLVVHDCFKGEIVKVRYFTPKEKEKEKEEEEMKRPESVVNFISDLRKIVEDGNHRVVLHRATCAEILEYIERVEDSLRDAFYAGKNGVVWDQGSNISVTFEEFVERIELKKKKFL
jgi:hypothetical protein